MGFFDKFKKKEEPVKGRSTVFLPKPLEIQHSPQSGNRKDKIYFYGLKNIDGKILMSVGIEEGGTKSDMYPPEYFVEPHYTQDQNGDMIEDTEMYYRNMAIPPKRGGDRAKYNAVKGFFQPKDITIEKIGSNYIGAVVYNNQMGGYRRQYDEAFKRKYIEKQRSNLTRQAEADNIKRQETLRFGKKLEEIRNAMEANIATPEQIAYYYNNVSQGDPNKASRLNQIDKTI